jgi:hypothetical protein
VHPFAASNDRLDRPALEPIDPLSGHSETTPRAGKRRKLTREAVGIAGLVGRRRNRPDQ